MGYTHYWRRPATIEADAFRHWADDVEKILAHTAMVGDVAIRGGDGTGDPEVTSEDVSLNGDEALGLDHETFGVARVYAPYSDRDRPKDGLWFDFCKTAHKPYDLVVCAALIRLKRRVPEVQVSSDGGPEDWADALMACDEIFMEGHQYPVGADSDF